MPLEHKRDTRIANMKYRFSARAEVAGSFCDLVGTILAISQCPITIAGEPQARPKKQEVLKDRPETLPKPADARYIHSPPSMCERVSELVLMHVGDTNHTFLKPSCDAPKPHPC